jgi:hypothetical protein
MYVVQVQNFVLGAGEWVDKKSLPLTTPGYQAALECIKKSLAAGLGARLVMRVYEDRELPTPEDTPTAVQPVIPIDLGDLK